MRDAKPGAASGKKAELPLERLFPWAMGKASYAVRMLPVRRQELFFEALKVAGVAEKEALNYAGIDAPTWSNFHRVAMRCAEALQEGWGERGSVQEMAAAARVLEVPLDGQEGLVELRELLAEPECYAVFWRRVLAVRLEGEIAAAGQVYRLAVGGEYVVDAKTGERKFRPLTSRTEVIDYERTKVLPGSGKKHDPNTVTWRPLRRRVTVETHPPNLNALIFVLIQRHSERWNKRKGGAGDKQAFEHASEIMAALAAARASVPLDVPEAGDPEVKVKVGRNSGE